MAAKSLCEGMGNQRVNDSWYRDSKANEDPKMHRKRFESDL